MEAAPSITVIEGTGPASKPSFSVIARADRKTAAVKDTYEAARLFADGFDAGAAYVRKATKKAVTEDERITQSARDLAQAETKETN